MLLIKTHLAPSAIHGLGLFTTEPVPAGTPVWRFQPGFDQIISRQQLAALPPLVQAHVRWHAYLDATGDHYVLSGDNARFMNHAAEPTTGAPAGAPEPVTTVTLRDLDAGEELTCDYHAFDGDAGEKLPP